MSLELLNPVPVGKSGQAFLLAQADDIAAGNLNGPAQVHDLLAHAITPVKPLQVWFKWAVYEPTNEAEYQAAKAEASPPQESA